MSNRMITSRPFLRMAFSLLLVSLIVGGAGAAVFFRGKLNPHELESLANDSPSVDAASQPLPSELELAAEKIPVRVFEVGNADESQSPQTLTGIVSARYETAMAFRVGGKIRRRNVEVGQFIKQGDLLFELDDEDYLLQQKTAAANLQVARANVIQTSADEKRLRQLKQVNALSEAEYERSVAAKDGAAGQQESALKQLELATNQLAYCKLLAETDGVITTIDAEAGQVVASGTRVCQMASSNELEAVVDIPENRLPRNPDLAATVKFWSLPDTELRAKLREVSPVADPLTRTYRARFSLLNPDPQVKLGMTAVVMWRRNAASDSATGNTFSIPNSALFQQDGAPAVWSIELETGKITAQKVDICHYTSKHVVVKQGLQAGQLIVSAGAHKLDASQRVRIWERQE